MSLFNVVLTLKTLGLVEIIPANHNQVLEFLMAWGVENDLMAMNMILFNLEPGDSPFWFDNGIFIIEVSAVELHLGLIA